jgi:hypothetical protein
MAPYSMAEPANKKMTLIQRQEHEQKSEYNNTADSPALVNFLESLSDSEYTRRSYLGQLNKFMKFFNIEDPQELLLWDQIVIADNIKRFVIACRKEGRAQHSIRVYYTAIKHLYEMNDVILNWKKIKMFVGKANCKRAADRPYTHDEIKRMLDRA